MKKVEDKVEEKTEEKVLPTKMTSEDRLRIMLAQEKEARLQAQINNAKLIAEKLSDEYARFQEEKAKEMSQVMKKYELTDRDSLDLSTGEISRNVKQ